MKGPGQLFGVIHKLCLDCRCHARCRVYGDTVAGMNAGALDMLHDTRDQDVGTVTYGIDLDLLTDNVFVDEDRMILGDLVDDADELVNIVVADVDLHALAAQNVGRSYQNRIAQVVGCLLCLFRGEYSMACRSRDLAFFQDLIKELTVLGCIDILCRGTKDRHAHLHEGFSQLDRGLSAELYYCAVRLFNVDDAFHILRGQRLKIQLICDIEVGTYSLRVVVDDDGLIAFL